MECPQGGHFLATARCEAVPIAPVELQAVVPFIRQPRPPPMEPLWHFSSEAFKDWDAHPEDLQTHTYGGEGDLKVATLNVNNLSIHQLGGVLWWMGRHEVDVMCLQDTRVRQRDAKLYKQWVREALGPQAKCFVHGGVHGEGQMAIGGQMIIVGQLWGTKCHDHQSDPSEVGVVSSITIKLMTGHLRLISTYWPVKTSGAAADLPGRLWNQVSSYLRNTRKSTDTPLEYIQTQIMGLSDGTMGHGGNSVILMGDVNAS